MRFSALGHELRPTHGRNTHRTAPPHAHTSRRSNYRVCDPAPFVLTAKVRLHVAFTVSRTLVRHPPGYSSLSVAFGAGVEESITGLARRASGRWACTFGGATRVAALGSFATRVAALGSFGGLGACVCVCVCV